MKRWIACAVVLLVFVASGAAVYWYVTKDSHRPDPAEDWFQDVTSSSGIDFVHDAGDLTKYLQPQIHGSGVALFDFDGDGLLDVYLLTQGGSGSSSINRLYKNLGNGKFKDVTEGSGLGFAGDNTGVAIGDVNNDGFPDVLVTQVGGIKLFLNNGDGTFKDITEESGLKNPLWASSASFVDYDRDGYLDLVVVNYLQFDPNWVCHGITARQDYCGPITFPGTVSKLFHNVTGASGQGTKGPVRFQDVTVPAGLAKSPGPGLGVYCADFNGDGWPDIFIANDGKPNHLWINQKNGTFVEEGFARGLAVDSMGQAQAGMGVAIGDVDGDALFDIYVTHLASERNTLWMQGAKRGTFRDRTAQSGLLNLHWHGTGFGTLMGDFDNNGWLDIAVVNGRISRGSTTPNPALGAHLSDYCERNQLFRNEGQGHFKDVSDVNPAFCGTPNVSRGLACGDLDGDGGLDLVVSTVAGRAQVFRNVAKGRGHWLIVRAFDPRLKRDAYGAEVVLQAGDRRMLRIINPGDSFQCSSDPRAHFGLGTTEKFDSIRVLWPDGLEEEFPGGSADRVLPLNRGEGKKVAGSEGS
jgi:hypothetical protein